MDSSLIQLSNPKYFRPNAEAVEGSLLGETLDLLLFPWQTKFLLGNEKTKKEEALVFL